MTFGAVFVVSSCVEERAEKSTSSTGAVVVEGRAPSDVVVESSPTGMGCPDPSSYFIEVTGDAATTMFRSSCANTSGDFGAVGAVGGPFLLAAGPRDPQLLVEACSDRSSGAAKISIVIGDRYIGTVYFKDTLGDVYIAFFGSSFSGPWPRIGPIGGIIEGAYAATLSKVNPDGGRLTEGPSISGAFRVCHLQDVPLSGLK